MLFNSYIFILIFLPTVLIVYFGLLKRRFLLVSKIWLVLTSLFFYGYWNFIYIPLLLGSLFTNFYIGMTLSRNRFQDAKKKNILRFGILFNIILLGYFKYTDFFIENFNLLFNQNILLIHIILPLGISFFTFTQIAFLVDAYKGEVKEYDLLRYMLFVTYFPHLLAGPILHHKEMIPQFYNRWNLTIKWRNIALGLFLFSIGLFKKVIIADSFSEWANMGFDVAAELNFFEAWSTSLSYTLQLYFDFSGYTDMAIGVSLMFNIKLPINFNSPYKAKDIQDFWRRWHITLSRFLRDYIYISLGGNRVSKYRNYLNLFSVFLIGGLWHGASWMFVAWGGFHGIAIVVHRIWKDMGFRMWGWMAWFITFNFLNITWIFFRAKDMNEALKILTGMMGINGIVLPTKLFSYIGFLSKYGITFSAWLENICGNMWTPTFIVLGVLISCLAKNSMELAKDFKNNAKYLLLITVIFSLGFIGLVRVSEFLYFRF